MSNHPTFHNHTHNHSSSNYHYGNHQQQRGYNSFIIEHEYIAQQIRNQYQTHLFQPPQPYYHSVLPSVVVNNQGPYYPLPYRRISGYTFNYINFWTSLLIERERNSRFDFREHYHEDDHQYEEKEDDDDDVLKYLKIRIHQDDGIDVESDICAICQSEYEHEESIGALQCGHEYHTDCIKQWLLNKKDCPMCRASVLPSQQQRSA